MTNGPWSGVQDDLEKRMQGLDLCWSCLLPYMRTNKIYSLIAFANNAGNNSTEPPSRCQERVG